eukprot:2564839-Rhodomonas_salina.3
MMYGSHLPKVSVFGRWCTSSPSISSFHGLMSFLDPPAPPIIKSRACEVASSSMSSGMMGVSDKSRIVSCPSWPTKCAPFSGVSSGMLISFVSGLSFPIGMSTVPTSSSDLPRSQSQTLTDRVCGRLTLKSSSSSKSGS